jgi:hypothetical protein
MDADRATAIHRRIATIHGRIATIARAQIAEATTIREVWLIYAAAMLPREAPPVDRAECRRAFYTGAAAALGLFFSVAEDDAEDVGAALAKIDTLRRELVTFAADLVLEDRP